MCAKARYESESAAKRAHQGGRGKSLRIRGTSFRLRVYFCRECRGFHVTNAEKR